MSLRLFLCLSPAKQVQCVRTNDIAAQVFSVAPAALIAHAPSGVPPGHWPATPRWRCWCLRSVFTTSETAGGGAAQAASLQVFSGCSLTWERVMHFLLPVGSQPSV